MGGEHAAEACRQASPGGAICSDQTGDSSCACRQLCRSSARTGQEERAAQEEEVASGRAVLQLLEELARRARYKDAATDVALAVFHALHDAGRLAALGTVRAL